MKTLKRILSVILVASMIFTSNAMITLAESAEGATITETIGEETISIEASSETVIVETSETAVGVNADIVGAKLGEPEDGATETSVNASETTVAASETTVGANTDTENVGANTENVGANTENVGANTENVGASEITVGANEATVGANARGARVDDIATASDAEEDNNVAADIEEIKIASASTAEIKTNDEELFGANTVYYAIAQNATTLQTKLYFSSSDLSTNTTIGTIIESGTVGTYDNQADRPWRREAYPISDAEILDNIKPTSMKNWFYNVDFSNSITGFDKIDTSDVTDMTGLFRQNFGITSLDLSSWDTSNVTTMERMFQDCVSLTSLNISGFNTSNVTNTSHMFNNCRALTTLDVSHFDTSNVTDMSGMFLYCLGLTSLDISNFNTSNVTVMAGMFGNSENITTITLPATLDTSHVTNMGNMFGNCKQLTTIDLSHFNTTSVTEMRRMFINCEALTALDLSTFNTNAVTNMNSMFSGCTGIDTITVSSDFVTTNVTDSTDMFANCTSLEGSQGTTLSSVGDVTDKTYARIDGGTAAPGLFSGTATPPATPIEILSISGLPNPSGEGDHILPAGNVTALNLSNLKINVKNDDNSTSEINYTGHESDFTFEPATLATSTTSLKIKYRNTLEKTIDNIFVYATTDIKNITGVAHTPTKTVYATGEAFDPTGLEIQVTQFDGTTTTKTYATNPSDFTFTPNPITAGTTGVTVKYGRYDNCTYVIPIVTVKKASTFTVNDGGIDKYYVAGETITAANFHNLTLNVTNEDSTTETITYATHPEYFTFNPALGTPLTSNQNDIKISYGGKTVSVPIVVEPTGNASGATEGTPPTRTNYTTGDPFDPRGLIITVTYPGGITKTIEYNDETKNDFTFSPNPFATPAEPLTSDMDHVTVIYKGATTNIPVNVRKEISTFTVINGPTNTEYSKGDKFDPTGIKVRLTFTDNTTEDIEYSDTTKDMFTFTPDLSHEFDNTDVGNKVQISISGLTPQAIDDMDEVANDSVVAVMLDADGNPQVVHNISRDDFIHALDDAINNGAIGFHEYTADGINDAKNKYDKYAPKTMNKDEAIAKHDEYVAAGLTTSKFIAATYDRPVPEDITVPADTPVKKTYTIGDTFDPTGLEIVATYADGTTAVIKYTDYPDDFTFKPALNTKLTLDTTEIIVTYKGIVIHIPLTINKVNVSNIVVPSNVQVKRTYTEGDKFDPTGLAITVNYINGASEIIKYDDHKNEFTFNPNLNTTLTTRNTKIDITYAGKTISLALEVNEEINPNPYHPSGDGGNSGGGSDPSRGPMGDLTKNPEYANLVNEQGSREVNTSNNLPTTDLMTDTTLVFNLLAYPENAAAPKINAVDINGNQGYGQWQHVPGTTTWYFVSGNFNKPTEPVGFLRNGWYNLGWKGESNWYNFDNGGVMRIGWYQENNKIYYLEADLNSSWYGRAVVGTKVIGGITYNFGNDGALIP